MDDGSLMSFFQRARGCILGLATGDSLGAAVEFRDRGTFPPVTCFRGGGPHRLEPGQWTDDTSMSLCLAESLIEKRGFDARDQMERYVKWWREGYLSSTGSCFDIGITIGNALQKFLEVGDAYAGPTSANSAGNGSIMRLAPIPIFFFTDIGKAIHFSGESSKTTHGAAECVNACRLFGLMLYRALGGQTKKEILFGRFPDEVFVGEVSESIRAIAEGAYSYKTEDSIEGSGYVIKSLEASLWCFLNSVSFEEAVLKAVNLGDDSDTTGAVCGQLAGAFYGEPGIPEKWRDGLWKQDMLGDIAERLMEVGCPTEGAVK